MPCRYLKVLVSRTRFISVPTAFSTNTDQATKRTKGVHILSFRGKLSTRYISMPLCGVYIEFRN